MQRTSTVSCPSPRIKSLNYLPNVLARLDAWAAGTAVGLVPVVQIDGRRVGSGVRGPVTQRMQALLAEAMARGSID